MKYMWPGDVLVVKGEDFSECVVAGDLMMGMAKNSGLRALIKDTYIRDRDGLWVLNIAFFAKGLNPNGLYKDGPGKLGLLVSIGDDVVEPGDLIVGKSNNVAIVP